MKKPNEYNIRATYYDSRTDEYISRDEFIKRANEKQAGKKSKGKKESA